MFFSSLLFSSLFPPIHDTIRTPTLTPPVQAALHKPTRRQGSRPQQPVPSFAPTKLRPPNPVPYITPPSSMTLYSMTAHQHPVYGYTDPDFDYKSEIENITTTALSGHKKGSTQCHVKRGHHRKWSRFCAAGGLRTVRDDHDANSG